MHETHLVFVSGTLAWGCHSADLDVLIFLKAIYILEIWNSSLSKNILALVDMEKKDVFRLNSSRSWHPDHIQPHRSAGPPKCFPPRRQEHPPPKRRWKLDGAICPDLFGCWKVRKMSNPKPENLEKTKKTCLKHKISRLSRPVKMLSNFDRTELWGQWHRLGRRRFSLTVFHVHLGFKRETYLEEAIEILPYFSCACVLIV